MDTASFHLVDEVTEKLSNIGCSTAFIPAGCTGYLQPLDVAINKPFKSWLRDEMDKRLDIDDLQDSENITSGNKTSQRRIMITQAIAACAEILQRNRQLQVESFQHTGIALNPDGSEDTFSQLKDTRISIFLAGKSTQRKILDMKRGL